MPKNRPHPLEQLVRVTLGLGVSFAVGCVFPPLGLLLAASTIEHQAAAAGGGDSLLRRLRRRPSFIARTGMVLLMAGAAAALPLAPAYAGWEIGAGYGLVAGGDRDLADDTAVGLWVSRQISLGQLELRYSEIDLERGALPVESWSLGWRWAHPAAAPAEISAIVGTTYSVVELAPGYTREALGALGGLRLTFPARSRAAPLLELTGRFADFGVGPVFGAELVAGVRFRFGG